MSIVTRRLRELSPVLRGLDVQRGTHAMGGAAGTISFGRAFPGTPTISLQLIQGTGNFGEIAKLRTPSIFSGSFTYAGSGGQAGTFAWSAIGP